MGVSRAGRRAYRGWFVHGEDSGAGIAVGDPAGCGGTEGLRQATAAEWFGSVPAER